MELKFNELEEKGTLEKYINKKRKRNASKEHSKLPKRREKNAKFE